ncbi:MAG: hypothetical protein NTW54_05200 [Bacteroidetes bacterium]|nr:hypothetical protein [Bacteroidota bacterium]
MNTYQKYIMENQLSDTDLILNNDGSVYHLHLRDEHIADHVIIVGDPSRVLQRTRCRHQY